MAKKATCPYCKQPIEDDNFRKYKNRKYHLKCWKDFREEKLQQQEQKIPSKQKLYDYICELFKIDEITPLMKGMLLTLKYFYETLGNSPLDSKGIGIIPYVYNDAKEDYKNRLRIKNNAKALEPKIRKIILKKKKLTPKLLDIQNIEELREETYDLQ